MSLVNWGLSCKDEITSIANHAGAIIQDAKAMADKFPTGDISILAVGEQEAAAKAAFFEAYDSRIDAMGLLDDRPFLRKLVDAAWPIIWEIIRAKLGS